MFKIYIIALSSALLFVSQPVAYAAPALKVNFISVAGVDSISALTKSGRVFAGKKKGKKIVVTLPPKFIADTSFFASFQGKQIGPVFAPFKGKDLLVLGKSLKNSKTKKPLESISLKVGSVANTKAYVSLKAVPKGIFNSKYIYTAANTKALGLNLAGTASLKANKKAPGDSDGDGVMDTLDVDVDGDGITNLADTQTVVSKVKRTAGVSATADGQGGRGSDEVDAPYSTMYLPLQETVNWHLNGSLSQSQIDATIGGANVFALAFFTSVSSSEAPGVTGGHLVCSDDTEYCKPSGGSAVYSGFSDGNQSLTGRLWSTIRTDGSPYSFEEMNSGGGGGGGGGGRGETEITLAGSLQPRVGTDKFFPGQNFRLDFTNNRGTVVLSKNMTLPLFFTSVPAIKSFRTTVSAETDSLINYLDAQPLGSSSNPIVLADSGDFSGKLRLRTWRLQRLAVQPEESGSTYRDYGNLNYGVTISNNSGEFTCGGLYSDLSSSLTETPSTARNGGFSPRDGASLWPLVDSSSDYEPSNDLAADSANTIGFTVDLHACMLRNGLTAGKHMVTLIAAGASFQHGANRAGQNFSVVIP